MLFKIKVIPLLSSILSVPIGIDAPRSDLCIGTVYKLYQFVVFCRFIFINIPTSLRC